MILLFEGFPYDKYKITPFIKGLNLDGIVEYSNSIAINYVGYFYYNKNDRSGEAVFILPKVFVYNKSSLESYPDIEGGITANPFAGSREYLAFGLVDPNDIIDSNNLPDWFMGDKNLIDIIYSLPIWLYRCIRKYSDRIPNSRNCICNKERPIIRESAQFKDATLMDIVLALVDFSKENKNYFTFVVNESKMGFNRINWRKTIHSTRPYIQSNTPLYLDPITKRKNINFEELLLRLFFSVIKKVNDQFDLDGYVNSAFQFLSEGEWNVFLENGESKLRGLKKNYHSDKSLELWYLLFLYFSKVHKLQSVANQRDLLLVRKFDRVFEDMIDYLISDADYPQSLKKHADGKEIDHIYREESLIYNSDIYYIGDSKYYNSKADVEGGSLYKQYTYAKNIIQRNVDVFHLKNRLQRGESIDQFLPYRDDLTEGYNITPNFFISAFVTLHGNGKYDFDHHSLTLIEKENQQFKPNRHFKDRLFDRDTLLLQRYNINFLYVLNSYVSRGESLKRDFKKEAKNIFKDKLIDYLDEHYSFYSVVPYQNSNKTEKDFVNEHFRNLLGRMFSFETGSDRKNTCLIVALEKAEELKLDISIIERLREQHKTEFHFFHTSLKKKDFIHKPPFVCMTLGAVVNQSDKFYLYLPLYSIEAACGKFSEEQEAVIKDWIMVGNIGRSLTTSLFIVKASGNSMEDRIYDGDYCVFEDRADYHRGDIVIVQSNNSGIDIETGGHYTIKKYDRVRDEERQNVKIILSPLNREFDEIILYPESEEMFLIKGKAIFNLTTQKSLL